MSYRKLLHRRSIFREKVLVLLCLLLCAVAFPLRAQQSQLSPSAKVSVITAAPGEKLYTLFGHTALRIVDPESGMDRSYNYGTFDFETPGFYRKFALGDLRYFLSTASFKRAKNAYLEAGRTVTEQRLNLSWEQTQRLFTYLEINARPENRYYSYEFFYDNCTTRVYDAIKAATGDSLQLQKPLNTGLKSFRGYINPYLEPVPWIKLGINLLLGAPADRIPSGPEVLFLPDLLKNSFANASIRNDENISPFVDNQKIYTPSRKTAATPALLTPKLVFWSLLVLLIFLGIAAPYKKSLWYWLDAIVSGIAGGVAVLILFLWLLSSYSAIGWNMNIVWILIVPIILYILIRLSIKKFWSRMA